MTRKRRGWRPVPCPATSYREEEIHWARYLSSVGLWVCERCGLSGTDAGYERLIALAIERFDLATGGGFREPVGGDAMRDPFQPQRVRRDHPA